MKRIICLFFMALLEIIPVYLIAQTPPLNIIVFGAHPDDCDSKFGGTAILFAQMGHNVKMVSLTNGDKGHQSKGGGALAKIRMAEAKEAGKRFGVEYEVMDNHDGELMPTLENRLKVIREIRNWNADIVISHRTNDYHPDHRYTGTLVQDAAYLVIVPNIAPDSPPLKKNPVFLYFQDRFKKPNEFTSDIAIDISGVFEQKIFAMSAHESQYFEWLPWTAGSLDNVPADDDVRLEWLANTKGKRDIEPSILASLKKWYGEDHAKKVKYVEAFEICEFGRRPADEEIRSLFPMMNLEF